MNGLIAILRALVDAGLLFPNLYMVAALADLDAAKEAL